MTIFIVSKSCFQFPLCHFGMFYGMFHVVKYFSKKYVLFVIFALWTTAEAVLNGLQKTMN